MSTRRVRVVGGPWPERIGCEGVEVDAPAGARHYPFVGLGKDETVVLLDNDPLLPHRPYPVAWSCVYRRKNLEFLDGGA